MQRITKLSEVVDWRLCIGCGACAYICPDQKVQLWDFPGEGIRPVAASGDCLGCRQCLDVCPAVATDFSAERASGNSAVTPQHEWGPVLEIWEGHAADPDIRFKGSSGGVLTALGAYCLEAGGMHGVLHIAQDPADPLRNRTRLSRTRSELTAATGSRYSPASVCDSLAQVEQAPAPCVVIGKPGEIAGLRRAQALRPALDAKVGVAISFFCAESPSTEGTVALLKKMGVVPESLADLRYRGHGWPGHFVPTRRGETEPVGKMTYQDSWAFLQSHRPWAVHLWPDGTGELADITCGDPWYQAPDGKNPGFSIVVVRTERGREILQRARQAGLVALQPAEPWKLAQSQPNLINKKRGVWGRRLALRLFGLPVTRFQGAHLFRCWRDLSLKQKIVSVLSTVRRIITRKFYRPLQLDRSTAVRMKGGAGR